MLNDNLLLTSLSFERQRFSCLLPGASVTMLVFGIVAFVGVFVYEAVNYNK
jgi:hypothetical protein